jgi:uncharacterized protein YjbJ (UPF0337 family)
MNWDRIAGSWKQLQGIARQRWGRVTRNYAGVVAGKREHLLGTIRAAYGVTREANEKRLAAWFARQRRADPVHK